MKVFNNNQIKEAASILKEGKLLAFPTETVFGVACIYNNGEAYNKLNKLKRRPPEKPYTLMVKDLNTLKEFSNISNKDLKFLSKFMPGSITVVVKSNNILPNYISRDNTIGIRIPSNKIALDLLKEINIPLLVPSLNRSGKPPLFKLDDIKNEFNNELDGIIFENIIPRKPSTVFSLINNELKLIREGDVSFNNLKKEYESI